MRTFLVVSNAMRTDGDFLLKDIPGTSGRADVVARCVVAAFLTSNGIRQDVMLHVICTGPPDPPKTLRFTGKALMHLNPDERTTAALLQRALAVPAEARWRESTPGIHVRRAGLEAIDGIDGPLVLMDEGGEPFAPRGDATYVLGDHKGLTEEQAATMVARGAARVSLGPVSLHTDQCIIVIHNRLDNGK
ncbi:MAG: tRNA (pseudouridine(54)-N(1))-methyltransferase TrmY [Thermoplasmata archaeon]|nr:tRNA (pseudouridine(54)-N(1))-methyltransferase TrmY [Thermoplasmata archaeon]